MYYYTKQTKLGFITITEEKGFIMSLMFGKPRIKHVSQVSLDKNFFSDAIAKAFSQLDEYFEGKRQEVNLPLNPKGTPFQQKVWSALLSIPYGETRSYKDIAIQIGQPNAQRAVGMANHENPIPILIPCHRVISADGSIGGYSEGLDIKTKLLQIEGLMGHPPIL